MSAEVLQWTGNKVGAGQKRAQVRAGADMRPRFLKATDTKLS